MKAMLGVEAMAEIESGEGTAPYSELTIKLYKAFHLPFAPFEGLQIEFSNQHDASAGDASMPLPRSAASDCLFGVFTIKRPLITLED